MARKKKKPDTPEVNLKTETLASEDSISETNSEAIPKNASVTVTSGITYQGQVKVIIKKGNKTISTKNYHNAGTTYLFKFLANCIGGDLLESDRPKYIQLFYNSAADPTSAEPKDNTAISKSSNILLNKATLVTNGVKLHFTIPCSHIITTTGTKINQAALYSLTNMSIKDNYSAYYNFTNEAGTDWDELEIASSNGDYNVFIEWTMLFTN